MAERTAGLWAKAISALENGLAMDISGPWESGRKLRLRGAAPSRTPLPEKKSGLRASHHVRIGGVHMQQVGGDQDRRGLAGVLPPVGDAMPFRRAVASLVDDRD